ncbi:MAG: hypothetical protein M3Z54_06990 [Gemmatimonadota bacterium]|nr:hypothetical protein [Gemmatimonadota bacterium]
MITRRPLLALLFILITSGVSFAQSSDEFGRGSGGILELSVKGPSRMSGSLGLTTSRGGLRGYGATFGGTIVNDRLWFFGMAERNQTRVPAPQIDANWNALLGSRSDLAASIRNGAAAGTMTVPSSFLSLHYTGIVSSNMFFTATVSRNSGLATQPISPNRPLW